jgi:Uma2 family endonuclease
MIAVLEDPEIRHRARPISVQTWHWMIAHGLAPRRSELIRGVIVEKVSKSSLHVSLSRILFRLLSAQADGRWLVLKEDPLTLADSEPEPDISVVPGTEADYLTAHPRSALLVVEIAVTTESADREMVKAYAEAGVPETWLVLATRRMIEVHTQPVNGIYQSRREVLPGELLTSTALEGITIDTAILFPATAPTA